MSFTAEVKDELSRVKPSCSECPKAELAALIRIQGTLTISAACPRLEMATETGSVARTIIKLLHGVYDLRTELTVRRSVLHKTHNYLICVPTQLALARALEDLGILSKEGFEQGIKASLVKRSCCAAAYLRGAFLAGGYIADPKGDFHFELTSASQDLAQSLVDLMQKQGLSALFRRRHNTYVIYMKGAEHILAFLALCGAHKSALEIEDARVIKAVRNDINRRVNAELANQHKTASAAMRQIAGIRMLASKKKIVCLPRALQEVAILRLRYPDASMRELGLHFNPPLSKNAIAHRLRRIAEIAAQFDADDGGDL